MKVLLVAISIALVRGMEQKLGQEDVVFPEPCWNEKAKIPTYIVNGAPVFHSESFVPKCDNHGMYSPMQCHGRECWCVTACGEEIPNTRTESWPTCDTDYTPPCTEMSETNSDVQCDKKGYFKHKQCEAGECFCVNKCGTEILGTRTPGNPRCKALFYRNEDEEPRMTGITDSTRDSSNTCPDNSRPEVCNSNACDMMKCPGYENAKCKTNRCKGCVIEFFNDQGVQVQCNDAKIGVCPTTDYMKMLIGEKCETTCQSDGECEGAMKCCCSGCGTECVPPKMDKYGSCPLAITIEDDTCTDKCNLDNDCSRDMKCCSNGCGKVCVAPKPKEKSGTCPAKSSMPFSTCNMDCTTDNDCGGTQKCCQTACGTMCTAPKTKETTNKARGSDEVCPPVPRDASSKCINRCDDDTQCEANEKCCSIGCGTQCVKSIKKATPPCWAEKENTPTTMFGGISMPVLGTHQPTCDVEGFHTPKQCDPSSGICWCVNSCGIPIDGTHTSGTLNCEPKKTPCHDKRRQLMSVAPLLGRFRVQCQDDGYYESRQCHGSTCWCTDRCGNEVTGTRGHIVDVSCECSNGERAWNCAKNPCDGVTCSAYPDAVCKPNMCGGCKAEFWRNDEKVECEISKNGQCPVTSDMPTSCSADCITDTDCPGTRKCCNNGCASICVSPVPEEKHGSCPPISLDTIGMCSTECTADSDCQDNQKCCFNGCGRMCTKPTIKTSVGSCPVPWQTCSEESKIDECIVDGECGTDSKCCESGCGKHCTSSQGKTTKTGVTITGTNDKPTVKYGTCPNPTVLVCDYVNECSIDSDCTENRKCCSNGCGKVCSSPQTMVKYGQCPRNVITSETCNEDTIFNHECEVDDQCPGTKKCCTRGCNRVCMDVWQTVKVGQCPSLTTEDYESCQTGVVCNTDDDCNGNKKCCNTPCGGTKCRNPTTRSTETCEYHGVTRVHGDVWQPDTCTTCKCWNGKTKCTSMTCPRLDYNCVVNPVEDQCCPSRVCERTQHEFLKCKEGDGTKHFHGDTWQPDPCTHCSCEDGDIWCSKYTCLTDMSLTDKPGCRLVDVPGRCCPEVVCEGRCVDHEGHYRYENDIWYTDPCTKCTCNDNRVLCADETHVCQQITTTPECQLEEVKGQCCPNVQCPLDSSDGSNCNVEDKTYGHGSKWQVSNQLCTCRNGRHQCEDISVNCPAYDDEIRQRCIRVNIPGAACPEFVCNDEPTCSHNGETHLSGESWHPDTCTTCACDKGEVVCLFTACPQPGSGCTARFIEGQCCPEITCPTYHHVPMCNSTGIWRTDGETWLENDCDVCRCYNGLTTCTPIECPNVMPTPGCHIVHIDGQCCPVKVCRGSAETCVYDGKEYRDGETFTIDTPDLNINNLHTWSRKMVSTECSSCTCIKGHVSCTVNVCPEVRPDCRVIENEVENRCGCPTIVCPENKLGFCPIPDIHYVATCNSECDADTDCTSDTKCCFNGCGMSCAKPLIQGCFDSEGVRRSNGDIWHKDDCVICKCINDQSVCSETKCPAVPSDCTVKPIIGQCCGELTCQPSHPVITCSYDNMIYTEGSTWVVDNCNYCQCVNGEAMCEKQECPLTYEPGCRPVYVPGKCCPEKVCKEPNSCEVNNKIYLNGESWYLNQCNECHCVDGKYYCSETNCPVPDHGCRVEEPEKNECCGNIICDNPSTTETCDVDGVTKRESEVWKRDPCTTCICKEGKTICTTNTCTKMSLRPGCRAVPVSGQCCPEIVCHDVLSCIVDGVEHRNGEQWLHDECTTCRCEHGNKYCTTKTCAKPENGCLYSDVMETGKCCQDIICPYASLEKVCTEEVENKVKRFRHQETWMRDSCTQCTCLYGVPSCNSQSCPMTVSPGCRAVRTPGQCCPNIVCDQVKTGQCPIVNPFLPQTITMDTCLSDTDCPGRTKCCSNGVARTCMASWTTEKPGVCPRNNALTSPLRSTCMTECTTDTDCVGDWKCCTDGGCSMVCRPPTETMDTTIQATRSNLRVILSKTTSMLTGTTKSGKCPNTTPYSWNFHVCISHCNVDIDCPGDNKCCSNGCGHQCVPPMNPTKVGICPINQGRQMCDQSRKSFCTQDSDCMGNKKCCNTGCGLECVVPDVDATICPSLPATCTKVCSEGYATDSEGCEVCKCKKPPSRCSGVMCEMFCFNGFATDSKGCEICKCKKPTMPTMNMMSPMMSATFCKPITPRSCTVTCSNGYATDSVGCEVCACRKPESECTPMSSTACSQYCPYGFATDLDGCDMCMCKQPTISFVTMGMCTPITEETCDKTMMCAHGFATNQQGCEICQCKLPDTEQDVMPSCGKNCPFGYATDITGRVTCKCKMPFTCPPVDTRLCNKDCPFGFASDVYGCEICSCKQPEGSCMRTMKDCTIKDMCAFGLATDSDGCDICKCKMPRTCTPVTPMTCKLNCAYGMASDENGCEICQCKKPVSECLRYQMTIKDCKKMCPFGLATDDQGCEICTCKQPNMVMTMSPMDRALSLSNTPMCKPVTCKMLCRDGFATDMLGCETCACKKPESDCAVRMDRDNCPMADQCPYGLATNTDGCEICQCKQPVMCAPVTTATCEENCVYGYATDRNGCEVCRCKKPILECSPMTVDKCSKTCTYGYATDNTDCEICLCKQPTSTPVTVMSTTTCPPVVCDVRCANGWATNSQGCEICMCKNKDNTCPVISDEICPDKKFCPNGLATNSEGCEICKCKLPVTCEPLDQNSCRRDCPNGYATDTAGCEICLCKKIPIADSTRTRNGMVCPQVEAEIFGICMNECGNDNDCTDNKMCCSNGCGRMCTEPVRRDSLCSPVSNKTCTLRCNWGLATDYRGCEICKCKSMPFKPYHSIQLTPRRVCKPVTTDTCSKTCSHGYATDSMGCETCKCRTLDVSCSKINENVCPLMKTSPYGLATNAEGCDICAPRNPIMCTPNTCTMTCAHGFATDNNGCEVCKCKKSGQYCVPVSYRNCPVMVSCPNTLATDENGCEICKCKMPQVTTILEVKPTINMEDRSVMEMVPTSVICSSVDLLSCNKDCNHGYATDIQGCDICECKKTNDKCPRLTEEVCPLKESCPFGLMTNTEGCEICACRQPSMCRRLTKASCDKECEYGFATDEKGCEVCVCKKSPLECTPINPMTCKKTCPYGLATNLRGCEVCQCKQPTIMTNGNFANSMYYSETSRRSAVMPTFWMPTITCTPLNSMTCPKTCNYGYMTNNMGCDICECKKPSTECRRLTDRVCPLKRRCEYGMMTNTDGCEICQCKQPSICENTEKDTWHSCVTGYATNEHGCEISKCKKPVSECRSFTCEKNCLLGYATDVNGCDICKCKQPNNQVSFMDSLELRNTYSSPKLLPTWAPLISPHQSVFRRLCAPINPITCEKTCEYGYATSSNGCEICMCRKPESECQEVNVVECPLKATCPYGLATNKQGCDVCQCKKPMTWSPVNAYTCPKVCPHGYATDMKGCSICQCMNTGPECRPVNQANCPKNCMEGYATDSEGCQVCKCRQPTSKMGISLKMFMPDMPTCERVDCSLNCQYGYATNSDGCHVCKCTKPELECAMVPMCGEHCPLGFETTEDGCKTCTCKKPKRCPVMTFMTCDRNCPNGYATDIQGCDICKCKKPKTECTSLADLHCPLTFSCPFDLATDNDGCEVCQCKMPSFHNQYRIMMANNKKMTTCLPVTTETCTKMCNDGYATDVNGCETCKCKRPGSECSVVHENNCRLMRSCPYGLATDETGCEICQCKMPLSCSKETCGTRCPDGYATDMYGCETCQCKNTKRSCDVINTDNCDLTCPLGLATDNTQCEICKCKQPSVTAMNVLWQVLEKMSPQNQMPFFSMALMSKLTRTTSTTEVLPNVCPAIGCLLNCQYGYTEDPETGCELCECKEPPKLACPPVSYGTVGMCVDFCSDDVDCPTNSLCCSNGCGKACVKGTSTECVDEHGLSHPEGDLWHRDSCTRCSCMHGKIKCTSMECQPVPENCLPVFKTGQCCPTFQCSTEPTCDREGQVWIRDICTNCTCKDGITHCMGQSCPKVKPGCVAINKEGQCCPDMQCTGCVSKTHQHFEDGQTWNEDMCTTCVCQNGQSMCTSMTCEAPKPGCTVIPKDGQCCPTIICAKGEDKPCIAAWRSVPTMLLMGKPVPAPGAFVPVCDLNGFFNATQCHTTGYCWCVDRFGVEKTGTRTSFGMPECEVETCMDTKGVMYYEGDEWKNDNCETCKCVDGLSVCNTMTCPSIPENCMPIETDDHCCPQYICTDYCIDVKANRHQVFDRWTLNSCTTCTCYNERVICRSQDCPTPTENIPAGCRMVPQEGECCPSKMICNDDCPVDKPVVRCLRNPCDDAVCVDHPDAKCRPNYCGGCNAEFYDEFNNKLTCRTTTACNPEIVKTTNEGTEMIPRCTPDGYYSPKQCDNTGACWCVDRTGEMIEDTKKPVGEDVECEEEPPCQKELNDIQDKLNRDIRVTSDPQCDRQGWYMPEQCNPSTNECWCSEKDGTEILGSRKVMGQELNCNRPCFGEKHSGRCTLTNRCHGDYFCHYLPHKEEGYCCKQPKN
ncbi:SCO-spondin-like [Ptychodera flava]|uniref:SCO-spondin-like n=1 Tax=Ptychodera flava TaxID=63121 RepID=UPI00396A6E7C